MVGRTRFLGTITVAAFTISGGTQQAISAEGDWAEHGSDSNETNFSPLKQIDIANVAHLGLAWFLDLPGEVSLEATPLELGRHRLFPRQLRQGLCG